MRPGCAADGCESWATSKGYCTKHYTRLQRHGTLEPKRPATRVHQLPPGEHERRKALYDEGYSDRQMAAELGVSPGTIYAWRVQRRLPSNVQRCVVTSEDHERRTDLWEQGALDREIADAVGVTESAIRLWRAKEKLAPNTSGRRVVSYQAVHLRLMRERGPARRHLCVRCGDRAKHWAYDYTSDREQWGPCSSGTGNYPYSTDLSCYQPMCPRCHRQFDIDHQRDALNGVTAGTDQ